MLSQMKKTLSNFFSCNIPKTNISIFLLYPFVLILASVLTPSDTDYQLIVHYADDKSYSCQLYYDLGNGYNENDSQFVQASDQKAVFFISRDTNQHLTGLRLDPANVKCKIKISDISIKIGTFTTIRYSADDLPSYIEHSKNIKNITSKNKKLVIVSQNEDPYIYFSPGFITSFQQRIQLMLHIHFYCLATMLFMLLVIVINCWQTIKVMTRLIYIGICMTYVETLSLPRKMIYVLAFLIGAVTYILFTVEQFLLNSFSNMSLEELVFHLKVPMKGTSNNMIADYFKQSAGFLILLAIVLLILIIVLYWRKGLRNCKFVNTTALLFSLIIFIGNLVYFSNQVHAISYIKNQVTSSKFIEEHYVDPEQVTITFPEHKRNLVYIYLESMESTFISKQEGGAMRENMIPELTELANDYVNFSENKLIGGSTSSNGTTWTVGAMFAQSTGLPLLIPIDGNSYSEYTTFAPGATSLGDLLEKEGYNQEIMVGSDLAFGGRDLFFSQHGNYSVWDYNTAIQENAIPSDYMVWWGFEDEKLFSFAKEEITKLAKEDKPFNFTMLTADTHHIGGYVCELCGNEHEAQYENVLSCSSRQVYHFVEWLQQQDFYENTTIVISGDHPTMDESYISQYYDESQPRKVYNCFINASGDDQYSKNREFNTFDLFPTTLSAMGVQIEGEHLGLGTNLFSGESTLAEDYGYDYIDDEFSKHSKLYEKEILGY